ncbi:MAG: bifunctional hydroxymethylpyrimidine kinase/phosphomethylpyrimidine kinase [Saprospiraceae bacterium]|nr:bifunctional hydroxymethylpyrimidine kinase/phosphomethylpyrimidine kinase [Saprospiraceae bacterium]
MSLLVVGTVAFDSIETPYGKVDQVVGGAATYISLAASYFTNQIKLVSVIGDDFPKETLDDLTSRGIDLEGLQIRQGEKSFFWAGKYHNDLNTRDTLVTDLNVLADFDPVLPDTYTAVDYVMLGNLTPAVQRRVLDQLTHRPRLVAMDTMNFWMDHALDELLDVLKRVDMLTINDEEARQLTGEYSLVKAAQRILTMGPHILVIKKGEHGALLFLKDQDDEELHIFYAPAMPLMDVFDPTGAGDTFAGGMIGYLAQTDDLSFDNLKRALVYGSAMASFCVEKFSIEKLTELDVPQILERIERFRRLVHFDRENA